MKLRNCCLLLILTIAILSCSKSPKSEKTTFTYTTSFGECYGYCYYTATFSSEEFTSLRTSYIDKVEYPDISCKATTIESYSNLIDLANFDAFSSLDTVIGCPDCADGGAESLQIHTEDAAHKVSFEYGKFPSEVEDLLIEIRKIVEAEDVWDCE